MAVYTPPNGIPALAYPLTNIGTPLLCSLLITRFQKGPAFINLQFSMDIHGFEDKQNLNFVYKADDLVPGKNSLRRATLLPPQCELDKISRGIKPFLRTLRLTITKPCDILCPISSGSLAPKCSSDPIYLQFMKLASAIEINILFDDKWLHRHSGFIAELKELIAHPFDNFRIANWSDFIPIVVPENLPIEPSLISKLPSSKRPRSSTIATDFQGAVEKAVYEDIPLYANTSNKRQKRARSVPLSPTEKPTTASHSPKPVSSPIANQPVFSEALQTTLSNFAEHVKAHLQNIYTDTIADAKLQCENTYAEIQEDIENTQMELIGLKEASLAEIGSQSDKVQSDLRESAAGVENIVEEHVESFHAEITDKLEALEERYDRLDALVDEEMAYLRGKRLSKGRILRTFFSARAASVP